MAYDGNPLGVMAIHRDSETVYDGLNYVRISLLRKDKIRARFRNNIYIASIEAFF